MGVKQSSPESQGKLDISGGVLDAEKLLSDPANQIGVCVGGCAAHAKQTHSRFISFLDDKLQKFRVRKERQECKKLVLVAGGNKSKYPAEGVNHGVQRAVVEWARGKTDVLCVCALSADMVEYKTYVDPTACGDNVVFLQTHTGGSERRKWIGKTLRLQHLYLCTQAALALCMRCSAWWRRASTPLECLAAGSSSP